MPSISESSRQPNPLSSIQTHSAHSSLPGSLTSSTPASSTAASRRRHNFNNRLCRFLALALAKDIFRWFPRFKDASSWQEVQRLQYSTYARNAGMFIVETAISFVSSSRKAGHATDLQQTILRTENFVRFIKATGFETLAHKYLSILDDEHLRQAFFVYVFVFQEEMILDTGIHVLARYIQPLIDIAEGNITAILDREVSRFLRNDIPSVAPDVDTLGEDGPFDKWLDDEGAPPAPQRKPTKRRRSMHLLRLRRRASMRRASE